MFAKSIALIFTLVSASAFAKKAIENPEYILMKLDPQNVVGTIMCPNCIADAIVLKSQGDGINPPLQYKQRAVVNYEKDIRELKAEILQNLSIPQSVSSSVPIPFLAGKAHKLQGEVSVYYSTNADKVDLITCVATIREKNTIHAIYVKATAADFPNCKNELVRMARSGSLPQVK